MDPYCSLESEPDLGVKKRYLWGNKVIFNFLTCRGAEEETACFRSLLWGERVILLEGEP
jgi:hypothetical protein